MFCSGVHLQTERREQTEGLPNAQQQHHQRRGHGSPTGSARRGHSLQPATPLHTEGHICEQTHSKKIIHTHTFNIALFIHHRAFINECVRAGVNVQTCSRQGYTVVVQVAGPLSVLLICQVKFICLITRLSPFGSFFMLLL